MKLLINDEYAEVGFWSFIKCNILTQLALLGIIYGGMLILAILLLIWT